MSQPSSSTASNNDHLNTVEATKKVKLVLSDLHLGEGLFKSDGNKNATENFYFDRELVELLKFFSSGKYGPDADVELILNGDILDFLSVIYKNIKLNVVTEKVALYKLKQILNAHPKVIKALKDFLEVPNHSITYQIGNHDSDFFFEKVREAFISAVTNDDNRSKMKFIYEEDHYDIEGNIRLVHGHQFETMHKFNFEKPLLKDKKGRDILNLPWGSLYVMNVINRKFKKERDYVDKVNPIFLMLIYGMITDLRFIIRFIAYTTYYYIITKLYYWRFREKAKQSVENFMGFFNQEFHLMDDGEASGRQILRENPHLYAVIMGHTHRPKQISYPSNQMFINTGSWMKMIFFDLEHFGKSLRLPFVLIEYESTEERPRVSLFEWKGVQSPFRHFIT